MLPLVLAAWEWWFGEKKWKRLVPFFAFSLLFGLQAIWSKPAEQTEYSLTFSAAAIWTTLSYYSSAIFFLPFAGLATLLVAVLHSRPARLAWRSRILGVARPIAVPARTALRGVSCICRSCC